MQPTRKGLREQNRRAYEKLATEIVPVPVRPEAAAEEPHREGLVAPIAPDQRAMRPTEVREVD